MKSTTSTSSAFASSTPATSFQVTEVDEFGSMFFGFTRGMSARVRQSR